MMDAIYMASKKGSKLINEANMLLLSKIVKDPIATEKATLNKVTVATKALDSPA